MRKRRKRGERRRGGVAKAVTDPQNRPFSLRLLLFFSPHFSAQPFLHQRGRKLTGELFWNQRFSLTVNRIRGRTLNTQVHTFRVSALASVCKGLSNNSWPMFFRRSQRMAVRVCMYMCVRKRESECERQSFGSASHGHTSVSV